MKKLAFIGLFLWMNIILNAQTGVIKGKIQDSQTNESVSNASILVDNQEIVTDSLGEFHTDILAGLYNITINAKDYQEKKLIDVEVLPNQETVLKIQLDKIVIKEESEVVVKAKRRLFDKPIESPVSMRNIVANEIQRNPGANRDISKAINSLPGVATTVAYRNDILVRGGGPSENKFYLDDIEIPIINHFATQGASGGPRGILNVDFLREVDFYSGAFPARMGNALSSILHFKYKEPSDEKINYKAVIGFDDVSFMADGPINENNSFMFSARKSNIGFVFDKIGLPFSPTYYDFQGKYKHRFKNGDEIYVLGVSAIDRFKLNTDNNDTDEKKAFLERIPVPPQWNYTLGTAYKHYHQNGYLTAIISRSVLDNQSKKYYKNIEQDNNLLLDYNSKETENKVRVEDNLKWNRFNLVYGAGTEWVYYDNTTYQKSITQIGEFTYNYSSDIDFKKYQLFSQLNYKADQWQASLGFRMDGNDYNSEMKNLLQQFSPRFSFAYNISNAFSFNFNTGIYYQLPSYTVLGYRENGALVNKDVSDYIQNIHYVAGLEYSNKNNFRATLEGFYKQYENYPFSLRNQISLANLGGDFGVLGNEAIDMRGKGKTYGVELLLQQRTYKNYYGILSYTLSWSKFTNNDDTYVPSSWDARHILAITAGKRFNHNWELGFKFRMQSGIPETPYDLNRSSLVSNWDIQNGPVYDYALINSQRGKATHQLDIRVDKKLYFKKWSFDVYLDVANVYGGSSGNTLPVVLLERDSQDNGIIENPTAPYNQQKYKLKLSEADDTIPIPAMGIIITF